MASRKQEDSMSTRIRQKAPPKEANETRVSRSRLRKSVRSRCGSPNRENHIGSKSWCKFIPDTREIRAPLNKISHHSKSRKGVLQVKNEQNAANETSGQAPQHTTESTAFIKQPCPAPSKLTANKNGQSKEQIMQNNNSQPSNLKKKPKTVYDLKIELSRIGASTRGKKNDLIERLESYRRNNNFDNTPIILPPVKLPDWPTSGFKTLTLLHRETLPPIHQSHIKAYIQYRQVKSDNKAIPNGERLLASERVQACSMTEKSSDMFFSGIVRAAMKKKLSYSVLIQLNKRGEIQNTSCECAAGKGPHGTCKHVACLLLMLKDFKKTGVLHITEGCTDILQTFHKPKKTYTGSPVRAINLGHIDESRLRDPRPHRFRKMPHYNDFVRSLVLNYSAETQEDLTMRFLYGMANMEYAADDHDYLEIPFQEYWVDRSNKVSESEAAQIEKSTRNQSSSRVWGDEREYRLTASRFGEICHITERRDIPKLCKKLMDPQPLKADSVLHGLTYEAIALEQFEAEYNLVVNHAGLEIHPEYNMLAGSTDGHVGDDKTVEVKAPYTGREEKVRPHSQFFPFLHDQNGTIKLKKTSNYYYQVQGQLAITGRKSCYFIVYTFKSLFVTEISFDPVFWSKEMLPKLLTFYTDHYRPYIADHMYESVGQVRRKTEAGKQENESMLAASMEQTAGSQLIQGKMDTGQPSSRKPCKESSIQSSGNQSNKSHSTSHHSTKCDDPPKADSICSSKSMNLSERPFVSYGHQSTQRCTPKAKRKLIYSNDDTCCNEKSSSFLLEGGQEPQPKKREKEIHHNNTRKQLNQCHQRITSIGCLFSDDSMFGLNHQESFEVTIHGHDYTFSSVMQAIVVTKALFAESSTCVTNALKENNPELLRIMYRDIKVDPEAWLKEEESVLFNSYFSKFMWCPELRLSLLNTAPHDLIFASSDCIFGGGSDIDDNVYEHCFLGLNMAGQALTKARDYIINLNAQGTA